MELPGKNLLKKAFLVAAAGVGLTGCAVVPYGHHGHVGVGVYVPPPPPVVVAPVYPVYPVYRAPVIVVPNHHHHHGGWHHRGHGHRR